MLANKRILVVEDEPIVAMMLEDLLKDLGAQIVGPASSLVHALALTSEPLDCAILDINLGADRSHAISARLRELGVPFIFATGYGACAAGPFADAEIVHKPYRGDHITAALTRAMDGERADGV
jgi:CheY-like chemotaxis protein